jgi:hypothetical protein
LSIRNVAKTTAIIVTVLLMTSAMFMVVQIPPVEAQLAAEQPISGHLPAGVTVDISAPTVSYLSFRPTVVGVGQAILINMWINPALASNNRYLPNAFVITITKPDGTKDVRTMDSEAATGAAWFEYVPDVVGNWTIKFEFLGTYFPAGRYYNGYIVTNSSGTLYGSAYYEPSSTDEQMLTVQQDFVYSWPPAPLPTDYWTRPVAIENREWWPILGSWPGTGYIGGGPTWDELYPNTNTQDESTRHFTPWVQGPSSAHIVWKRQGAVAGLIGGVAGIDSTVSSPGDPDVIYAGRCYQTITKPGVGSVAECYDLRTGEVYYEIPTADGGVTPSYIAYLSPTATSSGAPGEVGSVLAASAWSVELLSISGSNLYKVNPWTGAVSNYSISPLSGGTFHNQIDGYVLNLQDLGVAAGDQRYRLINWTTRGTSSTLASRIISNTTYARNSLPNSMDYEADIGAYRFEILPQGLSARYGARVEIVRLSTGELLQNITTTAPDILYSFTGAGPIDHGKYIFQTQRGYVIAFDVNSGHVAWRSEEFEYPWGAASFGAYSHSSAYGLYYWGTYAGVYAINWTDGKIVWNYQSPALANFESPYIENGTEIYPFDTDVLVADGKVFAWNTEHTESHPLTRGWGVHCINATTGELIWKISLPGTVGAIADGYATVSNSRDGYMYVFGKGKTATTVSAPDVNVPLGTGFTIKGTVMDMSPAQPNTPCVSKDSMTTQMEYLHKQMPIDGIWHNLSISGVPVILTAIGSDGSVTDLGSVTTNGYYGTFEKAWTPSAEGTNQIVANFASDDSYGSSAAATAVTVGPAPEPYPAPIEPEAPVDNSMLLYAILVLVVIAIIIGITALFRKR